MRARLVFSERNGTTLRVVAPKKGATRQRWANHDGNGAVEAMILARCMGSQRQAARGTQNPSAIPTAGRLEACGTRAPYVQFITASKPTAGRQDACGT